VDQAGHRREVNDFIANNSFTGRHALYSVAGKWAADLRGMEATDITPRDGEAPLFPIETIADFGRVTVSRGRRRIDRQGRGNTQVAP
jgi:hypothetical protein